MIPFVVPHSESQAPGRRIGLFERNCRKFGLLIMNVQAKSRWKWWWRVPALGLVLGCLAGGATTPARALETDVRRDATVEVVEKVMASVVNIAVETLTERDDAYYQMLRRYYNYPKEQQRGFSVGSRAGRWWIMPPPAPRRC